MKKRLIILFALIASGVTTAFGAACGSDSFDNYTGGFSCSISTASGQVTFSNFQIILNTLTGIGTGVVLNPNQFTVTPTGGGSNTIGFQFGSTLAQPIGGPADFFVNGSQIYSIILAYDVVVSSGQPLNGARANVQAAVTTAGNQSGSASLTKDIIVGGSTLVSANVNDTLGTSALVNFGPLSAFTARDTLSIQANNASATVTSFGNAFSVVPVESGVPEPMTILSLGLGLIGIGIVRRRRP